MSLPVLDLPPNSSADGPFKDNRHGYPTSVPTWARPRSPAPSTSSAASSRPASPARRQGDVSAAPSRQDVVVALSAGCQDDDVYKTLMPWSTYRARRLIVRCVEWESPILAKYQQKTRTNFLDAYFVWSSIFGTHAAFMVGLPLFWWFGEGTEGRALMTVLAVGVYASSVLKDMFCVPRPYTPPVERLSISSHGLEYGFPSTHSTNAVSLSMLLAQLSLRNFPHASPLARSAMLALCALYAISVVLGRLYCGMHSMLDCAFGTLLGAGLWAVYALYESAIEAFLAQESLSVPTIILPVMFLMISAHPQPVDDCPCFEDAIAFVAVYGGISLGHWFLHSNPGFAIVRTTVTQGMSSDIRTLELSSVAIVAVIKIAIGVAAILIWRIVAKRALYGILPPLFRIVTPVFELPRRFYRTAPDTYKQIEKEKPIQPIPSLLDLKDLGSPSLDRTRRQTEFLAPPSPESSAIPSPIDNEYSSAIKASDHLVVKGTSSQRSRKPKNTTCNANNACQSLYPPVKPVRAVRYDIDVIAKVVVYAGVGILATQLMPWAFYRLGLDAVEV